MQQDAYKVLLIMHSLELVMNKLLGITLLAGFALSGCDEESSLTRPQFDGKEELVSVVNTSWDKFLAQCPGLDKYSIDLTYDGLSDWTYLSTPMNRVDIKFKVAERPKSIPNSFSASGQNCSFGISPDGKMLRIQKSICVSICKGQKHQDSGTDYIAKL